MSAVASLRRIGVPRLILHASVLVICIIWLIPTLGILVTSFRDAGQITSSGWWTALTGAAPDIANVTGSPAAGLP